MANWDNLGTSNNVEDRRGMGISTSGLGAGTAIIVLLATIALNYFGLDVPMETVYNTINQITISRSTEVNPDQQPAEFRGLDSYERFVSAVLGSTDKMWTDVFAQNNIQYQPPRLVLFRQSTQSSCGVASSLAGPHYCPYDGTIYVDETFFDELVSRFGGSNSESAQSYVIAHEVGHHVQNLLGGLSAQQSQAQAIVVELQADCYAGLWARSIEKLGVLNSADIADIQQSIAAVGDDRIQEITQGRVTPENWTHGSSDQRVAAFEAGFESGKVAECDIN